MSRRRERAPLSVEIELEPRSPWIGACDIAVGELEKYYPCQQVELSRNKGQSTARLESNQQKMQHCNDREEKEK